MSWKSDEGDQKRQIESLRWECQPQRLNWGYQSLESSSWKLKSSFKSRDSEYGRKYEGGRFSE